MKLHKLVLKNVRNFSNEVTFDFSKSRSINTVSGINGSGKSTLFKCLLLCQKAYFANLFIPSKERDNIISELNVEFSKFFTSINAFIEVTFDHESSEDAEELSSFKILCAQHQKDITRWTIISDNTSQKLIDLNWNLENPRNIILYIDSNKTFKEQDVIHSNISIPSIDEYNQLIVDTIVNPESLFTNIYQRLVKDYLRERLVPGSKRDLYFTVTKLLLKSLLPKLELSNFSGQHLPNQFVLLGKNTTNGKPNFYDTRNLSSGEKVLFYSLLFINYVPRIGLLIIDEPENHFHEDLIVSFVKMLNDICNSQDYSSYISSHIKASNTSKALRKDIERNYKTHSLSQVYLLTHSKNLIYNNFSNGTNYYIDNGLKLLEFKSFEAVLRQIGLSSIYSKVLFVEGTDDTSFFSAFFDEYNIKVHPLGGCTQVIDTYKKIVSIKQYSNDYHFCFLIDKDTRSDANVTKLGVEDPDFFKESFIVLKHHELENYLLDADLFKSIIDTNKLSDPTITELTTTEIETIIFDIASRKEIHGRAFQKAVMALNDSSINKLNQHLVKKTTRLDSSANYTLDITNLITPFNFSNFLQTEFIKNYNSMEAIYIGSNWNKNWKSICDGKAVYKQTIMHFAKHLGLTRERLEREVHVTLKKNTFEVNTVINGIIKKFT